MVWLRIYGLYERCLDSVRGFASPADTPGPMVGKIGNSPGDLSNGCRWNPSSDGLRADLSSPWGGILKDGAGVITL